MSQPSFIKCCAFLAGILICSSTGCSKTANGDQGLVEGYPIAADVLTTRQQVIVPDLTPWGLETIFPYEISKYEQSGYGTWQAEPGLDSEKRLDLMPAAYNAASVTHAARLLNFFTLTDIHITDEESPAQAIFFGYKGGSSSAYSPVMLYTTQVLDAAVQTINALHKINPLDFGISLGDAVNSAQYNELRWYLAVLDGQTIKPDSGLGDDPVPGANNDYQDEFQAAGLDETIPWYQTLGNHDHFWMGSYPVNDYLRQAYTGRAIINLGSFITDPLGIESRGFFQGSIDGRTIYGDILGAGAVEDFSSPPEVLAADPNRRPLSAGEWMSEFFTTTSNPVGHGFTQSNLDNDFASYSFEPAAEVPLKVIVLDVTQPDDSSGVVWPGFLDAERYDWLVSELDQGQAEGQLMIIAAHMPIANISLTPNSTVDAQMLLDKLQTYPNLILWVAGHLHRNTVTPHPSPDANRPELGFWEVETASIRDFPQQFRIFEIVRNSDNSISIFTTNIDPAVADGSLAAVSRSYAVAAFQIFNYRQALLPSGAYNAELVKTLSLEMQARIQDYGTPIVGGD